MKLITYNPSEKMDYLFDSDSFLENEFPFMDSMIKCLEPRVNIRDEGSAFIFEASVAGYGKDEINLEVEDNTLTLAGDKKESKKTEGGDYRKREFFFSNFKRHFDLGEEIEREHISAKFENGILKVHLPKKEKPQPKKIPIIVN